MSHLLGTTFDCPACRETALLWRDDYQNAFRAICQECSLVIQYTTADLETFLDLLGGLSE